MKPLRMGSETEYAIACQPGAELAGPDDVAPLLVRKVGTEFAVAA